MRGAVAAATTPARWRITAIFCLVGAVLSLPGRGAAAVDLTAGYAFNEGSGATVADASGNGVTGTLRNGAAWSTGRYGNAVQLDGSNDFVDLGSPASLQTTGSITISAWINAAAFPIDDAAIVSKRADGEIGYQLDTTVDLGPRTIGFKLTNASGSAMWRYGSTLLQANTWYHVAGVYNAAARTLDVYLNGQPDNGGLIGTVTSTQQTNAVAAHIGHRPEGWGSEFNGRIDDTRIYTRALTQAEVQTDMNTPLAAGASDTTPPTVSITSPSNNATVNNVVNVTANASDDVGVVGVQFMLDGTNLGAEDTTSPYSVSWDTTSAANGPHSLTARARDNAGNTTTSSAVTVTSSNAGGSGSFQNEILITGLDLPTAIEFLPDGRMLIVELRGTVQVSSSPYTTVSPTPFLELPNVGSDSTLQQGVYDIALDPNFATNRFYYLFYTLGTPNHDRLSRFTANTTLMGTIPGSELVLFEDPGDSDDEHHGGAIAFGNDGKLYFTTGEHFVAANAQDLTNPRGKIHRINLDGTVPTDNPFYDGAGPNVDSIWAYGLRNPYRAYYDSPTGRFFIGDVGGNSHATAYEELNLGQRGANYGWPDCEQGTCGNPNFTGALWSYAHGGRDSAITAGFVYHGAQFPSSYQGSFFFADYAQNWIKRLTFDGNGQVTGVHNFEPVDGSPDGPYGDIVYLTEGPDGALYYVDLGYSDTTGTAGVSKIRRIRWVGSGNQAPVAASSASPTSGPAPLTVGFSSAGSSDPEGQSLTFSWTFGDGDTSTQANPSHTYTQPGQYTARLAVSDGVNTTLAAPMAISVGSPPAAVITAPQDGALFAAGEAISFSGMGTDPEDGELPANALTWSIDFLHDGHVHPGAPVSGVDRGTFTIPTSGHDFSGNTRYRITLTVTDSDGLTSTQSTIVYPRKVDLNFTTEPLGLMIHLDGIARMTPFTHDTLAGFNHTVEARNQPSGGTSYTFQSWSDGGAQAHGIVVPTVNQTLSAVFQPTDIQPPTAPSNLAATSEGTTQINLSWSAASDNVGVAAYRVERCQGVGCSNFAQIASVITLTHVDIGLVTNTSYTYRVRAIDAAGNLGLYSNIASTFVGTGLVAAYSFNEGSGNTAADWSGFGNLGTLSNVTWTTAGRDGNAVSFNGTSSTVTVPDAPSLDLTAAMTLEAWVNPSVVSRAWREVLYKGTNNYFLEATTNQTPAAPAAGATIGGTIIRTSTTALLPVNVWTHLAATYDGARLRLYVNGVLVSSRARTGTILTSTSPLRIGSTGSGRYFKGLIDDVRVFNVARTAAQILADMSSPVAGPTARPAWAAWLDRDYRSPLDRLLYVAR